VTRKTAVNEAVLAPKQRSCRKNKSLLCDRRGITDAGGQVTAYWLADGTRVD
jgi:hypothetical protein